MSKRQRAAALAAGIAVVGVLAITAGQTNPPPPAAPTVYGEPDRTISPQTIHELATSGKASYRSAVELDGLPPRGFIARERPRALAVARRFLAALHAYESHRSRRAAAEIAATSYPDIAEPLVGAEARLPAAMERPPPRAEVYAIDIEFDTPPQLAHVRAEVARGEDRSDIGLIVHKENDQWLVAHITE